jgi:16S rRNA (guanine527-N7)-methyltransferase
VRTLVEAFLHAPSNQIPADFSPRIEKFATGIALWGSRNNLTAHPEDPDEVAFHVLDSLMPIILAADETSALTDQFREGRRILDLGSGAGFPGLVLAAASSAHFTLVESRRKRASFLQFASAEMDLKNVVVEMQRGEDVGLEHTYDLVIARAFGEVAEFFALAARALKPGGLAMLYANPSQHFGAEAQRIPYRVARRGEQVDRILALRRPT